jgi:hypothetical protein
VASRGRKFLYGCGIGCLAVIILGVGSCVTFVAWLHRPGELLQPERLVGADTTGYVAWTLRLEDPGTAEFVQTLMEGVQRASERNRVKVHPMIDSWLTGLDRRRNQKKLREMFPLVAAWAVRPGSGPADDLHLYTVSLERAGNQLVFTDWLLGMMLGMSGEVAAETHRGERIYMLPLDRREAVAFFIRGNDLFFSSDLETATRAVDSLVEDGPAAGSAGDLDELLRSVPAGAPMRGAITNERGELSRIWSKLTGLPGPGGSGSDAWAGFRGVTIAGTLTGDDSIEVELSLRCSDAASAAAQVEAVGAALRAALESTGFPLEMETRQVGEWIGADLRLSEVTPRVEEFLGQKIGGS